MARIAHSSAQLRPAPADATAEKEPAAHITGDRDMPSVNRELSLQSRVSNLLAASLMGVLGVGLLMWYYSHAAAQHAQVKEHAHAASTAQAQGEMVLPPLGHVDPP